VQKYVCINHITWTFSTYRTWTWHGHWHIIYFRFFWFLEMLPFAFYTCVNKSLSHNLDVQIMDTWDNRLTLNSFGFIEINISTATFLASLLVSAHHQFTSWTEMLHVLETVHHEGDTEAGPEPGEAEGGAQEPGHEPRLARGRGRDGGLAVGTLDVGRVRTKFRNWNLNNLDNSFDSFFANRFRNYKTLRWRFVLDGFFIWWRVIHYFRLRFPLSCTHFNFL